MSCTSGSVTSNDQPEMQYRRSANYKQNIWNYNQLQSLTNQYAQDKYNKQGRELKEDIQGLLVQSEDALTRLELIDSIGKLGLATLFEEDIKAALKKIHVMKNHHSIKDDLYATSLCFRLLRQHGFNVSQDLFLGFMNDKRKFEKTLYLNVRGLIELLEASHFGFDGETVLDEAKTFATNSLRGSMSRVSNDKLRKRIVQALELPLHWSVEWYNAKRNINLLEHEDQTNHSLLKLAKLNFNLVQATHQNELREVSRWWHSIGSKESMGFARDRIVESYLTGVGVGFEPKYGNFRKWLAKAVKLVLVIDDVYDIYGSLQELEVFTRAVERWDKDGIEDLPQCMKICFQTLYDTTNDLAFEIQNKKCWSTSPSLHLQKVWVDFCKALLVEAKWYNNSYVPTFEEYLENAWISSSGPILSLHAILFLENQVDGELSSFLDKTKDLVYYTSLIIRLCNDQGTSAAELERGDSPSSVACYMREKNVTEKEARCHIENLVTSSWKVINKMGFDKSPTFQEFFKCTTNMARVAQFLYHKGDGFGIQDREIRDQILALLIEPLA